MTKETQTRQARQNGESNTPTYLVKQMRGYGKNRNWERLGAAWEKEDGSIYVKLHGTQIVEGGFNLFKNEPADQAGE